MRSIGWRKRISLRQRNADAVGELQKLRTQFPGSAMTEQALQSLGNAAIAAKQPQAAVDALDSYDLTPQRPALLFLRGEAKEQAGRSADAANDYAALYLSFPFSEHAREALVKLNFLRSTLGPAFPPFRSKNSSITPRSSSTTRIGSTRATNMPRFCRSFPAPTASGLNCGFSNAG